MKQLKLGNKFIKEKLLKKLIVVSIIFFSLILIGVFVFTKNQELAKEIVNSFLEANADMINSNGGITISKLILNNIFASLYSVALGFIPFLFVPVVALITNSLLIGATLGFTSVTMSTSSLKIFVLGILPHGILELPALLISLTMGIYLCIKVSNKILRREDEKIKDVLKEILRVFIMIIVPMLVLAGIIECLITPMLITTI
ncbi:MAG: stage II sporulation protein M [Romboutsia sp.]